MTPNERIALICAGIIFIVALAYQNLYGVVFALFVGIVILMGWVKE
jgi:hypothetical protein